MVALSGSPPSGAMGGALTSGGTASGVCVPAVVHNMLDKYVFWTNYLVQGHEAADDADTHTIDFKRTFSILIFELLLAF